MNTFAIGSLPVHFSVAKLFTFRWQYTYEILLFRRRETSNDSSDLRNGLIRSSHRYLSYKLDCIKDAQEWNVFLSNRI